MKTVFISLIISFLLPLIVFGQTSQLHLKFDNNLKDSQGNVQNISAKKTTFTTDRYGKVNKAIHFDGIDGLVKVPFDINHSKRSKITIVLWVKADTVNKNMCFLSHDDGNFDRSLIVYNGKWSLYGGMDEAILFGHPIRKDVWTFVAATYNQSTGKIELFVNDKKYSTISKCENGLSYFHLGNNPTFNNYFLGAMDDVRIYDEILNTKDIQALYQKEKVTND